MTTLTATDLRDILVDAFEGAAQALRTAPAQRTVFDTPPLSTNAPAPNRIALSIEEAAEMLGVGRTTVYQLVASGQLPSFHLGRRRLVSVAALESWVLGRSDG